MAAASTSVSTKTCGWGECQNTTAKLSRCSRCQTIWYCSVEHQKADWANHKPNCIPKATPNAKMPENTAAAVSTVLPMTATGVVVSTVETAAVCKFDKHALDIDFDQMLERCASGMAINPFEMRMTAFGQLPIYIGFNGAYAGNHHDFKPFIDAIVKNPNKYSDQALYNTYSNKETSRLHRNYAALALWVRHSKAHDIDK